MDPDGVNEPALSQSEKEESLDWKFKIVAKAFLELFELLEEYAPAWYAEEHHNHALAAHRILLKSRGYGNVTMGFLPK